MDAKELKVFWEGFPEAPFADTFKWLDVDGFEHMLTIRGRSGDAVLESVGKAKERIAQLGGIAPANKPIPAIPTAQIQERDESGVPVVDAEGNPRMVSLPDGVGIYTIKEVFHAKSKDGTKDLLRVTTVEEAPFLSRKYGTGCFHPPVQYKDFASWPVDGRYAPKEGAKHVVIRAPKDGGKYADVIEFRE